MMDEEYNKIKNFQKYSNDLKLYLYDNDEQKEWFISNKKCKENEGEDFESNELQYINLKYSLEHFFNNLMLSMIRISASSSSPFTNKSAQVKSCCFNPLCDSNMNININGIEYCFTSQNTLDIIPCGNGYPGDLLYVHVLTNPYTISGFNIAANIKQVGINLDFVDQPSESISMNGRISVNFIKFDVDLINKIDEEIKIVQDLRLDNDKEKYNLLDLTFTKLTYINLKHEKIIEMPNKNTNSKLSSSIIDNKESETKENTKSKKKYASSEKTECCMA
jgi:hypothetical protein